MKTMHLFAGGGGGLLSDLILGHNPIIAVEWEPYACQILRERASDGWFPDLSVWEGDVRLFDPSEYAGRVDCIHAGFPCQDISVAGKQVGLGEGTRSGLYREVLRIAGVVRPRYLFLENVSAILSNGLGTVLGDLAEMGYDCRWLCIRASDVGAPHGRDRWFALAHAKSAGEWGGERDIHQAYGRQDGQMCKQSIGTSKEPSNMADTCGSGRREQQQESIEGAADVCNAEHDGQLASEIAGSITSGSDDNQTGMQQAKQPARPSEQHDDVADTESRQSGQQAEWQGREDSCGRSAEIPNTSSTGLEGQRNIASGIKSEQHDTGNDSWWEIEPDLGELADGLATQSHTYQTLQGWWEEEPEVGRVTTGCQHRAAQLKALGNGQVPLQAAVAFKLLMDKLC